jgi:hypothetical protein
VLTAQDDLPTGLSRVAGRLVTEDVRRKARAVAVAARRLDAEPHLSRFLVACDRVRDLAVDSRALRLLLDDLVPREAGEPDRELLRLVAELACSCYYSATVLDFFDSCAPARRWRVAGSDPGDGRGLVELARARQAFSASTLVAWEGISRFRRAWGFEEIAFPDGLVPRARTA